MTWLFGVLLLMVVGAIALVWFYDNDGEYRDWDDFYCDYRDADVDSSGDKD